MAVAAAGAGAAAVLTLSAAGDDARYSQPLPWKKAPFSRVLALGYTDLGANGRGAAGVRTVGDQSCIVGTTVGFDIDDAYAFDIDEAVDLSVAYVPEHTTAQAIMVLFDKSGGDGRGLVEITAGLVVARIEIHTHLPRARWTHGGESRMSVTNM